MKMKVKAYDSPVDAYTFCQEELFSAATQLPFNITLLDYTSSCVRLDEDTFAYVSSNSGEINILNASVVRINRSTNTVQVVANLLSYKAGIYNTFSQIVALDSTHWLALSFDSGTGILFTLSGRTITAEKVSTAGRTGYGAYQAKEGVVIVNDTSNSSQSVLYALSLNSSGALVRSSLGTVTTSLAKMVQLDRNVYGLVEDNVSYDASYITPFVYDPSANTISVKKKLTAQSSRYQTSSCIPLGNRKVYYYGTYGYKRILTFSSDWNSVTYSTVASDRPSTGAGYGMQNYDLDTGTFVQYAYTTTGFKLWGLNAAGTELELKADGVIPVGITQLTPGYYGSGNTLLYSVTSAGKLPVGLYWSTADIVNPETYVKVAVDRVDGLLLSKASSTHYGNYFKWDPSVPMSTFGISERLADEIKTVSIMEVQDELNR